MTYALMFLILVAYNFNKKSKNKKPEEKPLLSWEL